MKLTLLTKTEDIARTLDIIWQVSKTDTVLDTEERQFSPTLLQELVDEGVPVLRHFYFTFLIEDMPIAFREQLVRSQYDHYWIQSGRITDWRNARMESKEYPDSPYIELLQYEAQQAIRLFIEEAHKSGVAPEDYRHLVPVGAWHRGIWTANLESLISRFKKRNCWVAQYGYWMEVLKQAKQQIEDSIGIRIPIRPPCKDRAWNHTGCTVAGVMNDRAIGTDPLPCCPIFLRHEGQLVDFGDANDAIPSPEHATLQDIRQRYAEQIQDFELMWGRNEITGS